MKIVSLFLTSIFLFFTQKDLLANDTLRYDFVVAKNGTGNFKTIQEAINAVPEWRKKPTIIFLKNGVYKEKLTLPETKKEIKLIGENVDSTIITHDDYASKKSLFGEDIGTGGSATFFIYGNDFSAENITFENSSGPVGQAVAVLAAGDRIKFTNCRFLGFQDTICTWGDNSRQYYNRCYVEGTVDFIFGPATAVFDSCIIYCKVAGFVTAASTPQNKKYGYVFRHCTITGSAPAGSFVLGRPWRPYARTVFIECALDKQIAPEGWNNWDNIENEKTAYYAEYKNSGDGFVPSARVKWAHQLTEEEVKQYNLENIFGDWDVKKR